eukprot:Clim_evm137s210 gene=Clim_evmTU137s210
MTEAKNVSAEPQGGATGAPPAVPAAASTVEKTTKTNGHIHFIAGGLAGTVGAVCTNPIEVVKTRLQSSAYRKYLIQNATVQAEMNGTATVTAGNYRAALSTFTVARGIWAEEGPRAFLRGIGPTLVGVAPSRAIYFGVYTNMKQHFSDMLTSRSMNSSHIGGETMIHLSSAVCAGVATATATNPIWLIKTRLQLERTGAAAAQHYAETHRGVGGKFRQFQELVGRIYVNEGFAGFYKGLTASFAGISESALQFMIYEYLKRELLDDVGGLGGSGLASASSTSAINDSDGNTSMESDAKARREANGGDTLHFLRYTGIAAVAKVVASITTYPHEVARTRMREVGTGSGSYKGFFDALYMIGRTEGVHALYGGMPAHLMRVVPNAAIMFTCYEAMVQFSSDS